MKNIILLVVIAFAAAEPDFYDFFEDIDLNSILYNDQEFEDFVDCALEKGSCKEVYKSYKDLFTTAVEEKCEKCTHHQRHMFWLFLQRLQTVSPDNYVDFRIKYDPENEYFNDLLVELQPKRMAI